MADAPATEGKAAREYAQLLRLHERTLVQLQRIRDDLTSPATAELMREIKHRTGTVPSLDQITGAVEEAIRALKLSESEVRTAVLAEPGSLAVEGVPNLPPHLERFLAERSESPGFSYEVAQDEERGWIIKWKEYTSRGTVRGYGQFYERPYAWLED